MKEKYERNEGYRQTTHFNEDRERISPERYGQFSYLSERRQLEREQELKRYREELVKRRQEERQKPWYAKGEEAPAEGNSRTRSDEQEVADLRAYYSQYKPVADLGLIREFQGKIDEFKELTGADVSVWVGKGKLRLF